MLIITVNHNQATYNSLLSERKLLWIMIFGVFFISFGLLALEITLTRLLSTILSYHYVFDIASLALLGLGSGGIYVHFFSSEKKSNDDNLACLARRASLCALAVALTPLVIIQISHMDNIRDNYLIYFLVLIVPFFLGGTFLSEMYRAVPLFVGKVYGADLVGAASACLGVIIILDFFGGMDSVFIFSILIAIVALVFVFFTSVKNPAFLITTFVSILIVCCLLLINATGLYSFSIPVGENPEKEIYDALHSRYRGEIIETKWSAFGRTDLVKYNNDPGHMDIYIDGTAGSPMYKFGGDLNNLEPAVENLKTDFPGFFPFIFLEKPETSEMLVIGPGGGRDILLGLVGGIDRITAVEVNREMVEIVHSYSWYNGGIFSSLDHVDIVVDEGRNFLRRQEKEYNVIMLSLPVTNSSRSREGYALTENFLFTVESIGDYFDRLTDEGLLVIVAHDEVQILRLLSIALSTLEQNGIDNEAAMKHVYILGSDLYPTIVLKKTPFERDKASEMHEAALREFGYNPANSYFPYISQYGAVNPALMAIGEGRASIDEVEEMVYDMGYNISLVTDNSPFFYNRDIGLPKSVSEVFWLSILATILIIVIPLFYLLRYKNSGMKTEQINGPKDNTFKPGYLSFIIIFFMLGAGFMLVEISLIQRFVFFLGQPVLSLTVLLFSILAGTGLGSITSGYIKPDKFIRGIEISSIAVVIILIVYVVFLPIILNELLGLELGFRILTSFFILMPLGFVMGFPFPLGIRMLKIMNQDSQIPWMWGINGASSVLGAVMTVVIAISFGFNEALITGAVCYLIVLLTVKKSGIFKVKA